MVEAFLTAQTVLVRVAAPSDDDDDDCPGRVLRRINMILQCVCVQSVPFWRQVLMYSGKEVVCLSLVECSIYWK